MLDLPILAKERTVAGPGFNRWLVPPAALAIHLCIGMAYGFSVFWLPLSKAIGIKSAVACAKDAGFFEAIFASNCDWKITMLGWMYTMFFVFLGSAAAIWGGWLEHAGPRKAGVVAAICWCGGLVISAIGVHLHQIWIMWLGSGVIGGIGLGLGYISPVSTLIKWFPDKRGMATGMAIMGFGGGAMVGSPLANKLMQAFATPDSVGVWQTFLVLAVIYFVFMMGGAFGYRVPAAGWKPEGWTAPVKQAENAMIAKRHVHLNEAMRTRQFWLIWAALALNVTAGIGVIGMASPILQEVFAGQLIHLDLAYNQLDPDQLKKIATIGAAFAGLISLFNIAGRFLWASFSDVIGRKATYMVFFVLGTILYASAPSLAHAGNKALFIAAICIILTMYGGGFSTVPAYLADMFGTQMVGAIHGRLLTAWSVAGIFGPLLVNYIRDYQIGQGVPKAQAYDVTMYILAGLLVLGFICNLLVTPVADKHFMSDEELAREQQLAHEREAAANAAVATAGTGGKSSELTLVLAWLAVLIPIAWGAYISIGKVLVIFE
ncbi:MAG TPA: OFA family MFS transporter [Burkholderiaceae bacterium]